MAFKKYTGAAAFDIVRGEKATVMNNFFKRVGKFSIGALDKDEKKELVELMEAAEGSVEKAPVEKAPKAESE